MNWRKKWRTRRLERDSPQDGRFVLHVAEVIAIVPAPVNHNENWPRTHPGLKWWVRGGLIFLAVFLVAGFTLAGWLDPYKDGKVWLEETHTQLRLPPCSFRVLTG